MSHETDRLGRGARRLAAWGLVAAVLAGPAAALPAASAAAAPTDRVEERLVALLEAPAVVAAPARAGEGAAASGDRPAARPVGSAPLTWAAAAAETAHRGVAPGIDLAFALEEARLDALWVVRPGGDPAALRLDFPGAESLALGDGGALVVSTGGVTVTFAAPVAYQRLGRDREPVASAYRILDREGVGLGVGEYDEGRPLWVRVEAGAAGGPLPNSVPPTVTATLVDSPGTAQPGGTIDYTAEIEASGMTATGVQADFSNSFDANVDLLPATVKVTPVAADEGFSAVGNTQLVVSDSASGLLANDFDPDNPTPVLGVDLFVAPGSVVKTGGTVTGSGTLTVSADGTFTYTPPVGETGTEIFGYTARDGDALDSVDPGFVTFTIADLVWYIDNAGGGSGGTGTSSDPFKTLADFMAVQGGGAGAPAAGDFIRLRTGTSAYDSSGAASLSLLDSQKLVGQGVDLVVGLQTIETGGPGQEPTITNTGGTPGDGIELASANSVSGLDVGATPGAGITGSGIAGGALEKVAVTESSAAGIRLVGATGAFTFDGLDIDSSAGTPGIPFEVSGGSADVTVNGDITQALNDSLIAIGGGHTGTIDFQTGTLSASNGDGLQFDDADGSYAFGGTTTLNGGDAGIDILGGSDGTFTFDSLTSITSPSGGAFRIVGDGTSSPAVTYSGTLANNAGDAISIQSTAAGSTITFDGAAGNAITDSGAGTGIFLSSVGQDVVLSADVELGGAEGIDIDGGTGTFTFADTDIVDPVAAAIDVNGGSAAIVFGADSSIAQGNGFPAVSISNGHSGSFTQNANATPAADAGTIGATGGTGLQFANADGAYAFNGTVTLNGGDAGIDILSGSSGSFAFSSASSITSPTGIAFQIDTSGGGDVTYAGTILQTSAASAVRVNAKTSGAVTLSGAVTAATGAATGIDLTGNGGATFTFSGGLDVDTTTGTGFRATGGGTLNVTGTNTVNTAETSAGAKDAGSAVVLSGMDLGDSDVTFSAIGVAGGTAAGKPAIDVDSTTNAGTFFGGNVTVAGTGAGAAGIDIAGSSAAFDFTSATIDDTGAAGIKLAGANGAVTFDTVDVDGTTGHGLEISGNSSSVLIDAGTFGASTTAGMDGVNVSGGSGNVTVDATIRQMVANNSVDVSGRTGGSVTFNGAIDDDAGGIRLASNGGGTIGFVGDLALDTGMSTAFSATGGGTVFATGTNRIGASTALSRRAVQITGTAIGASGVTFESIAVNGSGVSTVPAIHLDATGADGGLTVTGTGTTDSSGGTIQNVVTDAILLNDTDSVVLKNLDVLTIGNMAGPIDTLTGHDGIDATDVNGLTLNNVRVEAISDSGLKGLRVSNLSIVDSTFRDANRYHLAGVADGTGSAEATLYLRDLGGTNLIDNSVLEDGAEHVDVENQNVDLTLLTVQRNMFGATWKDLNPPTTGPLKGKIGVDVLAGGSVDATVYIGDPAETDASLGNSFLDARIASIRIAHFDASATGKIDAIISRNNFTVSHNVPAVFDYACTGDQPQGGVVLRSRGTNVARLNAIVSHNTFDHLQNADGRDGSLSILFDDDPGGTLGGIGQVKATNNTFINPYGSTIDIAEDGTTQGVVLLDGNIINGTLSVTKPACFIGFPAPAMAIDAFDQGPGGKLDVVVQNMTIPQHDTGFDPGKRLRFLRNNDAGGTHCVALYNVDANVGPADPDKGFELSQFAGTFNLEQGASSSTVPATVIADNGNSGPVVTNGTINVVGPMNTDVCQRPSGFIF